VYPLADVLPLLTCATIASCDDFEDIVGWGEQHLDRPPGSVRQYFESWIKELWPDRHDLIAIHGKTSRRTHDKRKGLKSLHTLSAYASTPGWSWASSACSRRPMKSRLFPSSL
jgi:hypothetical protein